MTYLSFRKEKETYRLVQVEKNEEMWNDVFKEHQLKHPACPGKLEWDGREERQQGLCWIETARCSTCPYKSKPYRLFGEVDKGKRGQKAAAPNLGIHAALHQSPVGYASLRKLLLSTNTPAPSTTGLFKAACTASKTIVKENKKDMQSRRKRLKEINSIRGEKNPSEISVEGDGAYNNPIYAGIGKTPFQAATQATYVIAESVTTDRQIIALSTRSKLCLRGARKHEPCPGINHKCSASIPINATIGNEQAMAEEALRNITDDGIHIASITTDPDSGAAKAAEKLDHPHLPPTEHFIDTRHLSDNQRKQIGKIKFSCRMFPGKTKEERTKMQKRFANDLVKRCEAEFSEAQNRYPGRLLKLKKSLSYVKFAIVKCYQQDHTDCKKHSFACTGGKRKNWLKLNKYNLPTDFKISCTEVDEHLLYQCIDYKLGPKILTKTRLGTNTQKVEATNRCLRRSLPKNVTYTTNFVGRAHAAIHSINNGPGESIFKTCKNLGAPVSENTKVCKSLVGLQKQRVQQLDYHKSDKAKIARCRKRQKLYKVYDETKAKSDYNKSVLCPKISVKKPKQKIDHSYSKSR